MEIYNPQSDENYYRYVGWQESNYCIKNFFSKQTLKLISTKVTELLDGVDPNGKRIIVPDDIISHVMSSVYHNFTPATGDIYGRYNVPTNEPDDNYYNIMIDQTIQVLVSNVKNNIEMDENNKKLTIWTTVLGDFNNHKLRQHAPIKVRERNTNFRGMVSFMNY